MNLYIKVPGTQRPAHDRHIKEMLLGSSKAKIPPEGVAPREVQGVKVWADARVRFDRFRLRVKAECPVCGKHVAAGRLAQHSKIHNQT